jgi:hypothetical protein
MAVGYKNENGVKITEESNRRDIVSAPKIATLLGVAGMFGVVASVLLGKLAGAILARPSRHQGGAG